MAQKYYNTQEAAKILGISTDDVKKMLERHELRGFRDGMDWKFRIEDIDQMAKQGLPKKTGVEEDEGGDVLMSEVALGQSDVGASGTVIGMEAGGVRSAADSDISLADSDVMDEGPAKKSVAKKQDDVDSKVAQFEELDLTLEEDLTLEDSSVKLSGKQVAGGSAIDLSGKDLDDDLVLGGSGTGSDVTIGGDSGISLVDPSDSGLSLEQPLDLSGAGEESLELGEDDMLAIDEAAGGSSGRMKTDDDFLLTPLEEAGDIDDSESGSQVIALDTEGDEGVTMIGTTAGVSMAAMLDEDLTTQPAPGMGAPMVTGPLLGAQPAGLSEGVPLVQPSAVLPEAPYTGLQITGLVFCALLLMLCGMMMFDLLRNMWSWNGPYTINSSLMDAIVGLFEGK